MQTKQGVCGNAAGRAFTHAAKCRDSGGKALAQKHSPTRPDPAREVCRNGSAILHSGVFAKAMREPHHWTTVGTHSLGVAKDAVKIAAFFGRLGLHVDRAVLVRCALCHDLGIIDRVQKYGTSAARCCREHPRDSLRAYEQLAGPASPTERDCILHHMFPLQPVPPHTPEGIILNLADKKSSIREAFSRKRYKRNRTNKMGA